MKVEIELPELPKRFEYTGEYRRPKEGEFFSNYGIICKAEVDTTVEYPILRKVKPPREFKDGSFYPVKFYGKKFIAHCEYGELWIHDGFDFFGQDNFSWIGEELDIEWGDE